MDVLDLLLSIENRKELYIGDGDLTALKHFADGYCVCARNNGIDDGEERIRGFCAYVYHHFDEKRTVSIDQCIIENTGSKEEAFDCFFDLLRRFIGMQKDG